MTTRPRPRLGRLEQCPPHPAPLRLLRDREHPHVSLRLIGERILAVAEMHDTTWEQRATRGGRRRDQDLLIGDTARSDGLDRGANLLDPPRVEGVEIGRVVPRRSPAVVQAV